jgi:hypothetical protein
VCFSSVFLFFFFPPLSFASRMCDHCGREVHLLLSLSSFFVTLVFRRFFVSGFCFCLRCRIFFFGLLA